MKILISGSTGTLGYGLSNYLFDKNKYNIIKHGFTNKSNFSVDFTDRVKLFNFLNKIKPDYIINLVCLSDVDECEKNFDKAMLYNSHILEYLSNWTLENKCKIIHISTDQVYDKINTYNAENETFTKNNYGYSKLQGEQNLNNNSCILRTNFFGFSNSKKTLNDWLLNSINNNNEVNLFNDIQFNPVLMDTLYDCIEHIINNFENGVFNFGSKNGLTKADFCINLLKKMNINYNKFKLVSVDQSSLFAYRPKGMMMNTKKFSNNFKFKIPELNEEINKYSKKYH